MDELSRIIDELKVPGGYLNPEIRCDFEVSSNRKKLWLFQIDILKEIERICKKYKLTYFAFAGTLLGAVRHKGFIPWDDDIDIGMKRNDYEILCKVAPYELRDWYYLSSPYTEEDYALPHIKIRNSRTAGATKYDFGFSYNKGIYIDIFPFDNIPDNDSEFLAMREEIKKKRRILDIAVRKFYYIGDELISEDEKKASQDILDKYGLKRLNSEVEALCGKYANENKKRCSWLGFHLNDGECYQNTGFEEFENAPFEFTTISIQKQFDEVLTKQFGDYMKMVKGGAMHGDLILSFDTPYMEISDKTVFEEI